MTPSITEETLQERSDTKRQNLIDKIRLLKDHSLDRYIQDVVVAVAFVTSCPISFFSVLRKDTQILKAAFGYNQHNAKAMKKEHFSCRLKDSMCVHTLKSPQFEPIIINDTHQYETFKNNPFVVGPPFFRFYAGFPIQYDNINIGALCCGDVKPKELTVEQVANMYTLRDDLQNILLKREIKIGKRWWHIY